MQSAAAPAARARWGRGPRPVTFRIGLALVGFLVLFALVGPLIAPHDPVTSDFSRGIGPDQLPAGPSGVFWLGTDRLFRDVFARLASGARISLFVGVAATVIATAIGSAVGMLAGWYEGRALDSFLMRLVDLGLAFPFLLIVMALGAALDRTTPATIFLTLGLTGWLGIARVIRAKTLRLRSLDFIVAARALGQSTPGIFRRHLLPNLAGPILVVATLLVAQMILAESVLAYLGVGLAPPQATWGRMIFEGQDYLSAAPWISGAPTALVLLAVLGFNLLGDGLRDALDPRKA